MTDVADPIEIFMAEVERIAVCDPHLSTLGAGILAGVSLAIAQDSLSFAKTLGIEHALVLREVELLADAGLISVTKRVDRTQRTYYSATRSSPT